MLVASEVEALLAHGAVTGEVLEVLVPCFKGFKREECEFRFADLELSGVVKVFEWPGAARRDSISAARVLVSRSEKR